MAFGLREYFAIRIAAGTTKRKVITATTLVFTPIDEAAQKHWNDYSNARNAMFERTSHAAAPWHVVKADEKKPARLELIRDLLASFSYKGKDKKLTKPDPKIVFRWRDERSKLLAH